jgi:UDPglucose--hexose-1-phosphate uridylyltransferase
MPATEIPRSAFDIAVFDNRFPSLSPDAEAAPAAPAPYQVAPAVGRCEVIVYTDQHDASLATLAPERTRLLLDVWADRYDVLATEPDVAYVMAFENRGAVVGVTLEHPHGQVYAYPEVPPRIAARLAAAARYCDTHGSCVQCDVVAAETREQSRVVARTDDVIAYVPFASRFPYEVQIATTSHLTSLSEAAPALRDQLAQVLHGVLAGYDRLFGMPLPYVMAVHQRPVGPGDWDAVSHLHLEISPPHRAADRLKYLAGSELAAGAFITDVLPEAAAERLREVVG